MYVSVDSFVYFGATSKADSDSAEHRGDTDVSGSVLACFPPFSPDGPYNDKIQVSPLQFVTNWTQSFNVTCLATDVYPVPSYVWGDIQCDNGNTGSTCTFTPHSPTHITEARCFVSHKGFGNTVALKRVQLNFKCKYKLPFLLLLLLLFWGGGGWGADCLFLFLTSTLTVPKKRYK